MFIGVFIDDDEMREKENAERLSSEKVDVSYLSPKLSLVELSEQILEGNPDIVALDYRLDEIPAGDDGLHHNRYKAGPLAQLLRDHCIQSYEDDFPIILVSNEAKIREFYDPDVTTHDLFDTKYKKEDIAVNSDRVQIEVLSLINGYKSIISNWEEPNRATSFFLLDEDSPPLQYQDIKILFDQKAPHQIANWVLRSVIERSGILLNEANLCARLGIDIEEQDFHKLKEVLANTDVFYKGIFSDGWERWWDFQLTDWGKETCGDYLANLTAAERVKCLNEKLDLNLIPAKSRWREGHADVLFHQACACCQLPTEKEFSVPAYDPVSYSFVQKEIICWDCVLNGRHEAIDLTIDESGEFIANKLENGELTKEA